MRRLWVLALAVSCNGGQAPPAAASRETSAPQSAPRPAPVVSGVPAPRRASPPPAQRPAGVAGKPEAPPEVPPDMALVPGGTFTMGADDEGEQDERPAHSVTVPSFLLDLTEVTNASYRACVQAGACKPWRDGVAAAMKYGADREFRGERQPVVGVSWHDATAYCAHVGKRLPTEAEWERAARGDDGRRFVWGNDPPSPKIGAYAASSGGKTADVGSFPEGKGPYGHLDLAGNVWEWVEDYYDPYAYKRSTAAQGIPGTCEQVLAAQDDLRAKKLQGYTGTNPIPTECERVLRGGAFNYRGDGLRASNRVHHPGGWRILVAGFRCARDLRPSPRDAG